MTSACEHTIHVNHRYLLHKAAQLAPSPDAAMLDFGCGRGEMVEVAIARNMQMYGAEVFYDPRTTIKNEVKNKGLLGERIREIHNGTLPFPDRFFDVVLSNQVFEHVHDLDAVLHEIARVLKPGGYLVSLFPSKDVIREGHCGIPGLHWFSRSSRIKFPYALCVRTVGFGYHTDGKTAQQWAHDFIDWLDEFTCYRSRSVIWRSFGKYFTVSSLEIDYIRFRLHATPGVRFLKPCIHIAFLQPLFREIFRKFGGLVLLSQKR